MAVRAIDELGGERDLHIEVRKPREAGTPAIKPEPAPQLTLPTYELGDKVRHPQGVRRRAGRPRRPPRGRRPRRRGRATPPTPTSSSRPSPTASSRCSSPSSRWSPPRWACRCAATCPSPSTFAAFFSRAYDFIRMAAISQANIRLSGSHAGVEIGADGPRQMALEDLAAMRAVHGSTVLYPSRRGSSAAHLVAEMADRPGDLLHPHHPRRLPGALRRRREVPDRRAPRCCAAATTTRSRWSAPGSPCTSALAAADDARRPRGSIARVIDCYSVKPIDTERAGRGGPRLRRRSWSWSRTTTPRAGWAPR